MMNNKNLIEEVGNDLRAYAVLLNAIVCAIETSDNDPSEYVPGLREIEHRLIALERKCKEV